MRFRNKSGKRNDVLNDDTAERKNVLLVANDERRENIQRCEIRKWSKYIICERCAQGFYDVSEINSDKTLIKSKHTAKSEKPQF